MNNDEKKDYAESISCMLDGAGNLESVTSFFRDRPDLQEIVDLLMSDERMRIRLGTTAVLEELKNEGVDTQVAIEKLKPLLKHPAELVRGDVVNLLGILAGSQIIQEIRPLLDDPSDKVRFVVSEVLDELREEQSRSNDTQ